MLTERVGADAAALVADPGFWVSWATAVLLALACLAVGSAIGMRTGLIDAATSRWERAGLALGLGTLAVAATYAAFRSGASSAYTPVAAALVAAVLLGRRRVRLARPGWSSLAICAVAAIFLGATAALYGVTIAPSARDGAQPVEFMDPAYYAVLGRQLSATGLESVVAPAGLGEFPGAPARAWYHWGEVWLSAIVLEFAPIGAMQARHFVVLPLLLLAIVVAVGGLVGRFAPVSHRTEASLLGAFGILTIAPVPLVLEGHFDWWARPVGFTVTLYGLAFVVALVGMLTVTSGRVATSSSSALVVGALAAALFVSHVLVAATAVIGLTAAAGVRWLTDGNRRFWSAVWLARAPIAAGIALMAVTVGWGMTTGHGFGERGAIVGVAPFDDAWRRAVILALAGAGVLLIGTLPVAVRPRRRPGLAALAIGALTASVAGAGVWGFRLADFNSFHVFYGAVAVLLTPIAVTGLVTGALALRSAGRRVVGTLGIILLATQGAVGAGATVSRLYEFGPGHYEPVPLTVLDYIKRLPEDAKLAYACAEIEEVAPWDARLISISAHTGRPVIPMCFQVDIFGPQLGQAPDPRRMNPFFVSAPQRELYPSAGTRPSTTEILRFLHDHGIEYIYADADHPNTLVPDASPRFAFGAVTILAVP